MGATGVDATARHRIAGRVARDARPHRPRALHGSRRRSPARPACTARGIASVRLGRRESDSRHAPRLGEGPPTPHGAPGRDDARSSPGAPGMGRSPAGRRLRRVPALPTDECRVETPLHRVLRAVRPALHGAARRLRARDDDDGGARGVRHATPCADRARPHGAPGRRLVLARSLRPRRAAAVRRAGSPDARVRARRVAPRSDGPPVLHVVLEPGRTTDDPVPAGRPRVDLVDATRGRSRVVRTRHRRLAHADAARRRTLARRERVPEQDVGKPRRPKQTLLGALVRTAPGDLPGAARRGGARLVHARNQPGGARASSASTPTRRPTRFTSSSGSSSSRS